MARIRMSFETSLRRDRPGQGDIRRDASPRRAEDQLDDAARRIANFVFAGNWRVAILFAVCGNELDRAEDGFLIEPGDRDVAGVDCFGALNRIAHRDSGKAKYRRLFADRATVGKCAERVGLQSQVVVVPERRQKANVWLAVA